jgi:hypothetical protein
VEDKCRINEDPKGASEEMSDETYVWDLGPYFVGEGRWKEDLLKLDRRNGT